MEATIASGGTTSDAKNIGERAMVGLFTPAAMTGTEISFLAENQDGDYLPIYDSDGNQVKVTFGASRAIGLSGPEADAVSSFQFIKLVSNQTEVDAVVIGLSLK